MSAVEKETHADPAVIYARFKDPENTRFIYHLAAETDQPIREIVERMVAYCRQAKGFKVPERRAIYADKQRESRERRKERFQKLAEEA